jgi:ACT domain-containing protein
MSSRTSKPSKSDRITELVNKVDGMRAANPYMDLKSACSEVGLSRDTYYLRKRAQRSIDSNPTPDQSA